MVKQPRFGIIKVLQNHINQGVESMNQMTFSDMEYSGRKRVTQKEKFLREMNEIIPWADWVKKIQPYYPAGKRGRPPRGIEVMLRMYLLQIWFNLSDEGLEDAIYDSYAMRNFVGLNFLEEQVPDATTLLKFRHLLEEHKLGEAIFNDIKERLDQAGLMMHGGTIVDATIIHSTPSTKNKEGKRDPEMHQTKKGNQWYHGMKVHSGVDCGSGYIHTITGTSANIHDLEEAPKLLREDDIRSWRNIMRQPSFLPEYMHPRTKRRWKAQSVSSPHISSPHCGTGNSSRCRN